MQSVEKCERRLALTIWQSSNVDLKVQLKVLEEIQAEAFRMALQLKICGQIFNMLCLKEYLRALNDWQKKSVWKK